MHNRLSRKLKKCTYDTPFFRLYRVSFGRIKSEFRRDNLYTSDEMFYYKKKYFAISKCCSNFFLFTFTEKDNFDCELRRDEAKREKRVAEFSKFSH